MHNIVQKDNGDTVLQTQFDDGSTLRLLNKGGVRLGNAAASIIAATGTITADEHAGLVIGFGRTAGTVLTLPAATGTGDTYTFFIVTAATSNANIIKVANATDVMDGSLALQADTDVDGTSKTFMAEVGDDTITMAGAATTGGIVGARITCTDYASGFWSCFSLTVSGGGSEATPFSATVS